MCNSSMQKSLKALVTMSFFCMILLIFSSRINLPLNSFNSIRENGEKACLFDN